jgi:hypothetical protein
MARTHDRLRFCIRGSAPAPGNYAAVRPNGFTRQNADKLTRVTLEDNGDLARSDWTFQDFVKFNIRGDRKLINLAMRNCVE